MTEHGSEADEAARIEQRNARLKNWALILGSIAALTASGTSLVSSLGLDKLVARRNGQQTAQTKEAYDTLVTANWRLREALRVAFSRIKSLEEDMSEVKEDYRMSMWMKMAAAAGAPSPPPPAPVAPAPAPAPTITSDVMSLLNAGPPDPVSKTSKGLFGVFDFGGAPDVGVELLDGSAPPKWEQVQRQAQERQ